MAIDKNSNGFTFGFATIMVVVVGLALSLAFMALKPFKEKNLQEEKMQNVLAAMNVDVERSSAPALYKEMLKEAIVIDEQGKVMKDAPDAFSIDVLKEYKQWKAGVRDKSEIHHPMFICENKGERLFVIPMVGTGLWGPIWGYVSVSDDHRTIYGSTFDHQGETPGLGAEITMDWFEDPFQGKTITDGSGTYTGIHVVKAGKAAGDEHAVDGITGGTITSNGVDEMLQRTLAAYNEYFKSL